MADRLVVDLNPDGTASVSTQLGDDLPNVGPSFEPGWSLEDNALDELRWYLEDYLRLPYGVYRERGQQAQQRLAEWGAELFTAVFGTGPARDAYIRLRDRKPLLVFRSSSPQLLARPWELMRDPDRPTPVALDLAGMSRSLPTGQLAETVRPSRQQELRVLMVIARPYGETDVGYQMIARPLLERLRAVHGEIRLAVLRPPTLDALSRTLLRAAEEGAPFQIVHFDGHGIHNQRLFPSDAPLDSLQGRSGEGVLVFEKPDGGADEVPASAVAQVLTDGQVPVVVLNACESGAIGKELEATIATRLLQEGTASVVAMAYSVYAIAAAEFMAEFYERLFAGDPVSAAVTAGRKRMKLRNERPSRKGDIPLDDWLIPVHYLREDVSFPHLKTSIADRLSLDDALDQISATTQVAAQTDNLGQVGSFIGRDWLFYQLETAIRLQNVVVLHGPGGTGKTELAKAFGRWCRDTGGVDDPRLVFFHSFEPGVATFGLNAVVNDIGRALFRTDMFDRANPAERRAKVQQLLTDHRSLLIWDNFETVHSMPEGKELGDVDRRELRQFMADLARHGKSAVLITSRSNENWLGNIRRIPVGGLIPLEANQYATNLLGPYPAAQERRRKPAFGDLMDWLDGHPLSMRLILPHLETSEPRTLLAALQGTGTLPGGIGPEESRLSSLPACIGYSYNHLAEPARRLLPALSLVQGVADAALLAAFSKVPSVPARFKDASESDWRSVLDDAARVGLLTPFGSGFCRIHPALPAYLAAEWRSEDPAGHDVIRDMATQALAIACAELGRWLDQQINFGDTGFAYAIIGLHRRTMGSMLSYALICGLWDQASAILKPLDDWWDARGLAEEADTWADQIRLAVAAVEGTSLNLQGPSGELGLLAVSMQARRQLASLRLDEAEGTYQQILSRLEEIRSSPWQQRQLATTDHQLGLTAQHRGKLDDAENWYRKALILREELNDKPGVAATYHQLGTVAEERGRFDDAEGWYRRALTIMEELGDRPHAAATYHQLGTIAGKQGRLDDAEKWYRKALTISEELADKPGMALIYHDLGNIACLRGALDEAENWQRKALILREELADKPGIAASYYQLGMIARDQSRLDEAENWYRRALMLREELGNRPGMALSYGALGLLAERRSATHQALDLLVRSIVTFDDFPHPMIIPVMESLARLARQLRIGALEQIWQEVTGNLLPQSVRDYVKGETDG